MWFYVFGLSSWNTFVHPLCRILYSSEILGHLIKFTLYLLFRRAELPWWDETNLNVQSDVPVINDSQPANIMHIKIMKLAQQKDFFFPGMCIAGTVVNFVQHTAIHHIYTISPASWHADMKIEPWLIGKLHLIDKQSYQVPKVSKSWSLVFLSLYIC